MSNGTTHRLAAAVAVGTALAHAEHTVMKRRCSQLWALCWLQL